ncbi:peptidoglycan D,D-transpeptidase FtsI family protein [Gluconobacter sphaericus]|uniref:Cell division protein n=1 Tax=Gluconobacter sphaericus NBRC 12467 TaxID=1307951 RepID=A0AA37SJF5_9PROT|nr:penicillin-binding protein 2 [Gluconobacter sphaericus]MBF0886320.1 penicillin-binding protein 2 [Gluconobacter sphaericus]MBS1086336.1 penicillin-binding protein 2 [Gluconobacter sphaericus]MBS1100334.1 penicillin-binding protein 2 [Gluconobacter sphaericus]GEB43641.1 cell division protein [Gluconobacter sphaericus NBRC 12467]GLQ85871.1 cell division protein [Gluconobacter sphaericus NBRC 12467]
MPQDVPPSSGSQRPDRPDVPSGRFRQDRTPRGFRRLNLDQMHGRLLGVGMGFLAIYGAVALKATVATVLMPMEPEKRQIAPQVPEIPKSDPRGEMSGDFVLPTVKRATITDRTGQALALSLPVAQVYANPMELIDPADAADKLRKILPQLNRDETIRRLSLKKQFVYLARDISPVQEIAINNLGIPGIYFEAGERRHYPLGRTAAQIMGSVDIDDHGIAGVERYFDKRLNSDRTPLRLSLDVRVQTVAHDELQAAKDEFSAIGASAIVMDVRTGEILAMVSLPDYDANDFGHAPNDARFNRAVTGMYEPGSTFKLQTAAMGLQLGIIHLWDRFSTIPIKVGRFTIRDMKTDHFAPWLSLPGVLAFSSNPAAAHIALDVGATRQQDWLRNMGFFNRVPVELPEAGRPLVPASRNWGISTVMTVGFGHGVAEPPLAIVRGTAATVNGGILLKPTLVARDTEDDSKPAPDADAAQVRPVAYRPGADSDEIGAETPVGTRVLSEQTSVLLRKLLRLDVTMGSGKSAEVPGYYVGGKTGTAEKIGAHGGYLKHVNVSAFTSVFPMNNPHYAVYVMLDSPQGTAATHGWTTAAWNAAPTVKKIISRVGPILNQFPDLANKDAIDASLAIPMNPPVPPGYRALGPGNDPGDPRNQARTSKLLPSRIQH